MVPPRAAISYGAEAPGFYGDYAAPSDLLLNNGHHGLYVPRCIHDMKAYGSSMEVGVCVNVKRAQNSDEYFLFSVGIAVSGGIASGVDAAHSSQDSYNPLDVPPNNAANNVQRNHSDHDSSARRKTRAGRGRGGGWATKI